MLHGLALGTLAYALAITALLLAGLAQARSSDLWLLRDIALVVLAGGTAALGRWQPAQLATVLLGAGIAWSELGLVDMHLLRLFTFPHLGTSLDLLFHGAGFLLVLLTLPRVLTAHPKAATA